MFPSKHIYFLFFFQVHGQGQETKVKLVASNNGMNAKPKVTITYADHLDLEESVMNVSSTCKEIVTPNGGHGSDLGGLNADSSSSPLQRVIQLSYNNTLHCIVRFLYKVQIF